MQQGVMIVAITFRLFLETGKETKRFEDCSKEEVEAFNKNASRRLGKTLSQYYTHNPQELERLAKI